MEMLYPQARVSSNLPSSEWVNVHVSIGDSYLPTTGKDAILAGAANAVKAYLNTVGVVDNANSNKSSVVTTSL